jgi:hypothetical protein
MGERTAWGRPRLFQVQVLGLGRREGCPTGAEEYELKGRQLWAGAAYSESGDEWWSKFKKKG